MAPEEKKIEEAAHDIVTDLVDSGEYDSKYCIAKDAAIELAKSDAARDYHTKGMYSQDQVFKLLEELQYDYHNHQHSEGRFNLKQWFYGNSKTV